MEIVFQEMKKIISIKKLLYLAGFAVLYFIMFMRPYVRGDYATSYQDEADVLKSFMNQFGLELTEEEFLQLKEQKPEYVYGRVDQYIAGNPDFAAYNIGNLRELLGKISSGQMSLDEENRLWFSLYEAITSEEIAEEMERMIVYDIWDYYIAAYERETTGNGTAYYNDLNEQQLKRVTERNEKEVYGILPSNVVYYNFEVLRFTAVFMALSMLFMIMPYMVSENRSRMPALQCSFKIGRRHYRYRLCAVLLTCLLMALLEVGIYAKIAAENRVPEFWDSYLSAYSSGVISWFPWTFGQYVMVFLLIAAAFSVGLSLAVFAVTGYLDNYVTAIAWICPAAIAGIGFCGFAMFSFGQISGPRILVPGVGGIVLAAGILTVLIQERMERRKDICM